MQHGNPAQGDVVDALLVASRALVGVAARSLADIDVTLPQYRALVVVGTRPAVTVGDLASALDIHPTTATRMCDRLVAKRLLRRVHAAGDRRAVELHVTAAGRRLLQRVVERRRRDLAVIVDRLGPDVAESSVRSLTAFAEAAGEESRALDPLGWSATGS
ncbi:MarR family transcriptional regulator [Iamia sp. SCSIO 61187]|uniref:MarR family winged helix-turn-helix transcriptional regulator n=1 Tax=Iamia sp. SCSIO 61187 TaxID=2722752 RepID=UPI001C627C65|nr:MarR family transcriptional regulator [Iamia sp. SCSIO 61187]QYG92486.1 MarR family transcriptional regulator [Iamia sp. SCSIO 61187]